LKNDMLRTLRDAEVALLEVEDAVEELRKLMPSVDAGKILAGIRKLQRDVADIKLDIILSWR